MKKSNDLINNWRKLIISWTKYLLYMLKKFSTNDSNRIALTKHYKARDHYHFTGKHRGAAHNISNLRYKIQKDILLVFHNGSKYDYHFIIKELAKEFKGQFESLVEITEKYLTFSVPIKKELENDKAITYEI